MVKNSILLIFLAVVFAVPCQAAPRVRPERFTLHYDVYGGGFTVLNVAIDFDMQPTRYSMQMKAQPSGALGYLLPWAGDHFTTGTNAKGKLSPIKHEKISLWRGNEDHVVLNYKSGVLQSQRRITTAQGKKQTENVPLDPAWTSGTTDTLTNVLQMLMNATANGHCNSKQDVYDGRRRFALSFADQGVETLAKSTINMYAGAARKCQIELIPEKGFDKNTKGYYRIQEDSRAKGQMPRVWLAPVWDGGPVIPVRILVQTQYGAVFVHLVKVNR